MYNIGPSKNISVVTLETNFEFNKQDEDKLRFANGVLKVHVSNGRKQAKVVYDNTKSR